MQVQKDLGLGDTCLHSAVANFDLALTRADLAACWTYLDHDRSGEVTIAATNPRASASCKKGIAMRSCFLPLEM